MTLLKVVIYGIIIPHKSQWEVTRNESIIREGKRSPR